jgi:hypothetical protein
VDDNVLSGVLPDFWAALPALTTLRLDFNFFSGVCGVVTPHGPTPPAACPLPLPLR